MPDYKELYLKLFRATETAMRTLITVQQECEELYLSISESSTSSKESESSRS